MPRITRDVLANYQFGVGSQHVPDIDPADGQPRHDHDGQVKTREEALLAFVDPTTGHEVHVPLSDDARRELARQLTGGVVVAKPGDLRPV
jgi:hypothetical protein